MKTFKIFITIDDGKWVQRGTIRGRSEKATLRRAFNQTFNGHFDGRKVVENTVFHQKYQDMPVLKIEE